jgi:protein-tyrosine phosphatase
MVQAYEQYAFLYEVCRKVWEEKYGAECVGGEHTHEGMVREPREDICGVVGGCG